MRAGGDPTYSCMLASDNIPLSELSRGNLEALAERLLAENAALKQAIAELREEVSTLKGLKGRARVKPSGMDKGIEPKPAGKRPERSAKGSKSERLAVGEERIIKAEVPPGSRFKGYEDLYQPPLVVTCDEGLLGREKHDSWGTGTVSYTHLTLPTTPYV